MSTKRLFDIALALVGGLVFALPALGIAALIWWRSGGPVLYRAERMKRGSQPFALFKFRTMHEVTHDSGVSGADKEARITPEGRWLRRLRLDEIPQLWNILKGDMSFVGPRPPLRQYVERFPDLYHEVLQVRPGLTGLATLVFHRHEARLLARCATPEDTDRVYAGLCVPRKAKLDLIYRAHASLPFDVLIILKTISGVFRSKHR